MRTRDKFAWALVVAFVIVVYWVIYMLVMTSAATAQTPHNPNDPAHWYDADCCSLQDCRPMTDDEFTILGDRIRIHSTGEEIPLNQSRVSRDGQWHRCVYLHNDTTRKASGTWCVYGQFGY